MDLRIDELETRFTHQERQLNELSEVVWSQQKEIDALKSMLQMLEKKVTAGPGPVDAQQDDKPPHY